MRMEKEEESSKWKGCIQLPMGAPLEIVWEIIKDFFGVKKWHPGLDLCERVEGTPDNILGCIRYVTSSSPAGVLWAKEKMNAFDSAHHSYHYAVDDTNIDGIRGFQGAFHVIEGEEEGSCVVKWSFAVNPVPEKSEEEHVSFWASYLSGILKNLQDLVASPS